MVKSTDLYTRVYAAMRHTPCAELMVLHIVTSAIPARYPNYYMHQDPCTQLANMILDLVAYIQHDPMRPMAVYQDQMLHTPCEGGIFDVVATYFCERYPALCMDPEPIMQMYHMLMMLLDYMEADPLLPDPLFFD